MKFIFAILVLTTALAEEPKAVTHSLTETQWLKIENLELKLTLLNQQVQVLQQTKSSLLDSICKEVKLNSCSEINLQARTITGKGEEKLTKEEKK